MVFLKWELNLGAEAQVGGSDLCVGWEVVKENRFGLVRGQIVRVIVTTASYVWS